MNKFFKDLIESVLLKIFVWAGTKLWGYITMYQPEEEILAIHFGKDEQSVIDSMKAFNEDEA